MALNSQRRTSEGLSGDEIVHQRQARAIGSSPTTDEPRASFSGETEQEREDREVVRFKPVLRLSLSLLCLYYQLHQSKAADLGFLTTARIIGRETRAKTSGTRTPAYQEEGAL
jgi:hypothetical protein